MCKKMTVAYGEYIGNRHVAWVCFNGKDYSFLSDKLAKARMQSGDVVNGLMLDAEGGVCIDKAFTKSLMGKSGLTFRPIMAEDGDEPVMNKYYALVKVTKDKQYHFITNRCGYEVFDEAQMKAMLAMVDMGGVRLDEKGGLKIHASVEVEGASEAPSKATGGNKEGEGKNK